MTTNLTAAINALATAKAAATKSAIMTAAWVIFKTQTGVHYRLDFASCLRRAWSEAKANLSAAKNTYMTMTSTANGRKHAAQAHNANATSKGALYFYANRNRPEYSGLNHNDAITALERLAAKSGFVGQVAATCLSTGRISEKQLAILNRAM